MTIPAKGSLISKIGLGTAQIGMPYGISNTSGQTDETEAAAILSFAAAIGIDLVDTASSYGTSEGVLGRNNPIRFKVVSKFITTPGSGTILSQLKQSLHSLNSNQLYGYLAHRPMDLVNNPEYWLELKKYREEGLVVKIGFSFNEIQEVDAVLSKGFIPDIVQVPYNYTDNRFLPHMFRLKELGCEIHARSPFLQGLFFADPTMLNPFFEEIIPTLIRLQGYGKELPGMLLRYCCNIPCIDKVIFGVNTVAQLMENIKSLENNIILPDKLTNFSEKIITPSKWPE